MQITLTRYGFVYGGVMKYLFVTSFAVAAALTSTQASAQDEKSFSGFYVGAVVGYDHNSISDGVDSASKDGVAFAAVLGYDADLGAMVVGAEAEFGDSTAQVEQSDVLAAGDKAVLAAGRDIYVGGRIGAKIATNYLLYGKVGYTNFRLDGTYTSGSTVLKEHVGVGGMRFGGGIQYSMGRFAMRAEYRYSDYQNFEYMGFQSDFDAKRHQAVIALLGKF